MPDDTQRLLVSLEAKIDKFEKAMAKATNTANTRSRQIEKRFQTMNAGVSASFSRLGTAFGAAFAADQFRKFADAATRIDNMLKVAGLSGNELTAVYERLKISAMANAAPLESLAELYSRASLAQKELGVSSEELLGLVNNVAVALRVGGRSAQESRGALLQLSQALGSGIVRAEEFNSILEGALPIAQAAAAGLEEAGGSVAKLRVLVIEGKVSSQAFFRAIEAGADTLKERLAGAQLTIAQSSEKMKSAMIDAVGKLDDATGASKGLTSAMGGLATSIEETGDYFERNAPRIKAFENAIGDMYARIEDWKNNFRQSVGLDVIDDFLEGTSLIEGRIGLASNQVKQHAADLATASGSVIAAREALRGVLDNSGEKGQPPPKTVSLKDFPIQGPAKSGSGHVSKAFESETENIRERTALLNAETAARARLNPLAADYDNQVLTAVTKQKLLNAAQEQGLKLTPELETAINGMASGYARASTEADKLEASQRRVQERAEDMSRLERDVMASFISDVREGTSAAEMLANALNKIADKLIDMALDDLFATPTKGGVGGLSGLVSSLGSLFGKGFAGGGSVQGLGSGTSDSIPARLSNGEFVMRAKSVDKYGRGFMEAINSGRIPAFAQGGFVGGIPSIPSVAKVAPVSSGGTGNGVPQINVTTHVSVQKGDEAAVTRLIKELPRQIDARIMDGLQRGKFRLR